MLEALVTLVLLFVGIAAIAAKRRDKKEQNRWNDADCPECNFGVLKFTGKRLIPDVGVFFGYECSEEDCSYNTVFTSRMHDEWEKEEKNESD